jgi:replicative DNA helicase
MPDQPAKSKKKAKPVDLDDLGRVMELGNKPPQALDVEEAVLGAMLIEPASVDMALEELSASCFYSPRHKMIFEAMSELVNDHVSVDIVTVSSKLSSKGNLEAVGGPVALVSLSQKVGAAAHIEYYIKILKQKSIQRDLITASYEILKDSYDDSIKVDNLIDAAQSKIYNAIQSNLKKDVQEVGSLINDAMKEIEHNQEISGLSGVPSGFISLDRVTRGWQKSDLIILAARPSVGKTAFALNLARNAAVDYHMPVAVFSLEMSALQLVMRLMTTESGLSGDKLKGGTKLDPWDWQQLETRLAALSKAPLYIDDTPSIPLMEFRTKIKRLVKSKGVRLVIVDYLQLIQGPAELRGMREQEVAAISRTLKATAKELNVPIIALSQLSRDAVKRTGGSGKPQLSDLRESGSIEQDADMVIFIHRPDYVGLGETPDGKETTQIIIAKHRNGEVCDIDMLFKAEQVRFVEPGDSLTAQAEQMGGTESAMNSDFGGGGEFDANPDF